MDIRDSPRVLLVGGASCVGKTSAAREITSRRGAQHVLVDEEIKQLPKEPLAALEIGRDWGPSALHLCSRLVAKGLALEPHLSSWLQAILESKAEAVLEGEGIQPAWTASLPPSIPVRAVFVVELSAEQIRTTLEMRSGAFRSLREPDRRKVVAMDLLYNRWIRREARAFAQACIPSRPWGTLAERILAAGSLAKAPPDV